MSPALPLILVLSRNHEAHGVNRLQQAAELRSDCELIVLDPHTLRLHNTAAGPHISHDVLDLRPGNLVLLPRIASLASEFALYCLEHLEAAGIPSLTPFSGLASLRHKFSALTALARAGIPVPDSVMLRNQSELAPAVESVGGYPLILKFIRGSQGIGVILAEREDTVRSVLDALNAVQYDVLLQRYIPEAAALGTYRVLVIESRARYAVHLTPAAGRDHSNVHAGGKARLQELTPELAELSEQATAVFGIGFAGVDLVQTKDGLSILEVNGSPGFAQPEILHEADIAGELLDAALRLLAR
jgi:ribosomal protein S6--L-glutamate ligase